MYWGFGYKYNEQGEPLSPSQIPALQYPDALHYQDVVLSPTNSAPRVEVLEIEFGLNRKEPLAHYRTEPA